MNLLAKFFTVLTIVTFPSLHKQATGSESSLKQPAPAKIQAAILLDVSGSMNGLIEQAKSMLWNTVLTLGKAHCADKSSPQVELALYEYGRTNNNVSKGYVKQLSPFTSDLDEVSKILFSLHTDGGDEYCGQVIYTSIDELKWEETPGSYKVIFIAGNEDFLQGSLHYLKACAKAREKGVIVNTIYCGNYQNGIKEHWNLAGECGNGSFTNINHNATEPDIPTPYDSTLIVLNNKLNSTYMAYGATGQGFMARQKEVDQMNFKSNKNLAAKRVQAKANSKVYSNAGWDMIDASLADSDYIPKVDKKTLPDSLQNKTNEELRQVVKEKSAERKAIQEEINIVNNNRSKYISEQKLKTASTKNEATLESEVEKIIKEQVKRFNMQID